VLTRAGIECEAVLKGTAEYDHVAAIWIEHLKSAMSRFSPACA
jgi:sirohydrochlorin cobaltochelatase